MTFMKNFEQENILLHKLNIVYGIFPVTDFKKL